MCFYCDRKYASPYKRQRVSGMFGECCRRCYSVLYNWHIVGENGMDTLAASNQSSEGITGYKMGRMNQEAKHTFIVKHFTMLLDLSPTNSAVNGASVINDCTAILASRVNGSPVTVAASKTIATPEAIKPSPTPEATPAPVAAIAAPTPINVAASDESDDSDNETASTGCLAASHGEAFAREVALRAPEMGKPIAYFDKLVVWAMDGKFAEYQAYLTDPQHPLKKGKAWTGSLNSKRGQMIMHLYNVYAATL